MNPIYLSVILQKHFVSKLYMQTSSSKKFIHFFFFMGIFLFRPRLNIPIFLPTLGWKDCCRILKYSFWHFRVRMYWGITYKCLGWNSNGKVRFDFFQPKYSGSPLEVGPLISVGIFRMKFTVPFWQTGSNEQKTLKSHSYWLARFNRKLSFRVFPLVSDRSVWNNGKYTTICIALNQYRRSSLNIWLAGEECHK